MRKIVTFMVAMLSAVTVIAGSKNDWRGKVVDEKGEPVAYANVAVLSKADSTVVCGVTTEEDGTFNIVTKETDGIMMVAMLGYKTQYLTPVDGAVICLLEDNAMLEGAAISVVMPKTKLTGEGLQTSVRGSVLENVGNANDVLEKTPGIIKGQNGLEVIGKGAPLVYINGRKVTDSSELTRLQSNEIQSVEVITNPGAQYDATVRSVVRIRTIRRKGDGFSLSLNASDAQSLRWGKGNDPSGAVNVNYRTGGVDIFGGVNYDRNTSRQISDLEKTSFISPELTFENKGDLLNEYIGQSIYGNAGVNWQIADNHSVGAKLEWGRTLQHDVLTEVHDNVFENGTLTDRLATVSRDGMGAEAPSNLGVNVYYNGVVAQKLGIDINFDYYGNGSTYTSHSTETSDITHDAEIFTTSRNTGRLYAAKAVLSYPIWTGQLQVGTEETFSRLNDSYNITGVEIPASSAKVIEDNYAGFLSYGCYIPKVGQLSAGVRYEFVNYAYRDAITPANDLTRRYGNWFPTFSYANVFGPVQLMFNYSAKTRRPNYSLLSSAVRYNSRYIWQSGNANLQPEISHNFSLMAIWKFITLGVNYARTDGTMMTWSAPFNNEGVILVKPQNITTPYRAMAAFVNLTPTIGPWTMNYTLGVQPQWLSIDEAAINKTATGKIITFNGHPIWFAQLFNTFRVKGGWQFEVGAQVNSPGYSQNLRLKNVYCDISAAVQKTLLKDGSLVLRLEGSDLAGMAHYDVDSDFGSHVIYQTNMLDTQRIKFSIRYSFNAAQSKYKGTGAGSDSKGRL